jgi:RNA polymerase sigma factor (sigma-70 family)
MTPVSAYDHEVIGMRETAARVVGARHRGPEAEDLVQEAWARAAVAVRDRPVEDPYAYTAAVAANLVRVHGRREASQRRWAAKLFVRPFSEAPDAQIMVQEEQAAMAMAIQRLPAAYRELLVAHTVHGRDTVALAASTGSTPGAVAAGLARARAMLRVEYVISFRRLPRPSEQCLRTLYAISAGDTRRQARLQSDGHVAGCPSCRPLAETLRERRRPSVATLLALRLARWTGRLSHLDGAGVGQRVGVAGGLVGMGVAGVLVLGGSTGSVTIPVPAAPRVAAAAVAPLKIAATPLPSAHPAAAHRKIKAATPVAKHAATARSALPQVDTDAGASVSPSGVTITMGNRSLFAGAPSAATWTGRLPIAPLHITLP